MAFHAFVDETKAGGLTLVATVVAERDVTAVRAQMSGVRPKQARRLHFRRDQKDVKKRALKTICKLPVSVYAVDVRHMGDGVEARQEALRILVPALYAMGVNLLVIERDESMDVHDKRLLFALEREGCTLRYMHQAPEAEPILWVSDGVAWCMRNKDRRWRAEVKTLVTTLPPASHTA